MKFKGILIALIAIIIATVVYPLPAWIIIVSIAELLSIIGINIDLAGNPTGVDPGAVLAAIIYFLLCLLAAKKCYSRDQKPAGIVVVVGGALTSLVVFVTVSSVIWL